MLKVNFKINGIGQLCFSRYYITEYPKEQKENHEDYEKRTWMHRLHTDREGYVVVPGNMFKNCLAASAKFLGMPIPGNTRARFTKHFEAGLMLDELEFRVIDIHTGQPIRKEDVKPKPLHVPSDGKRGGTTRVMKYFPCITDWTVSTSIIVIDDTITRDAFMEHLKQAGMFIGIGSFRPRNNGDCGRFLVESIEYNEFTV